MKVFLMYRDRDFDTQAVMPSNELLLTQDLELKTLFNAMSGGDSTISEVVRKALLMGADSLDTIQYRQNILKDCLKNASVVHSIYDIAVASITARKKHYYGIFTRYPDSVLRNALELMQVLVSLLIELKTIAETHIGAFDSEGFQAFFTMLMDNLSDEYLLGIRNHMEYLRFRKGVLISAGLGTGNKGVRYMLHRFQEEKRIWWKQLWQAIGKCFFIRKQIENIVRISERDESGARVLTELRNKGMNLVADALARSADHILGFLDTLRMETAFYVGCLNLHDLLVEIEEPVCFPLPLSAERRKLQCIELYDVCLSLIMRRKVVGNDLNLEGKDLVIITGANQGGKSTFLRSIGLSRLMMQCGMFVGARYFCSDVCAGVFTHYKREEDTAMNSGKLDEEISRMSDIADDIRPNSVLLFNESFAATNEREGSEIARQITCALMEKRVKVFFVTHQYEFARIFHEKKMDNVVFLRADRRQDGSRSFRLMENPPLETSFGEDLYHSVFTGSLSGKKAGNTTYGSLHP